MRGACAVTLLNYVLLLQLTFHLAQSSSALGKSRQRRLILFPQGSTFVQMVLGFGLPFEVDKQSVTIGPFVKSYYVLPQNSTDYTQPSIDVENEQRRRADSTRWSFYNTLSTAATFMGYGGKACVLRAICETAEIPFSEHSDIFTEIFHVIFTPSTSQESVDNHLDNEYHGAERIGKSRRNCARVFSECKVNLMDTFTSVLSLL